jgi:hypothetical protein
VIPSTGRRYDPQHPLYIVSKGRSKYPYTIRGLSAYRIPFHVIVEAPEREAYAEACAFYGGFGQVLTLDPEFQRRYDACMTLAPGQGPGSGPARNFAWEHSIATYNAESHWVMDDNIDGFFYYRENRKIYAGDATPFRLMEDFVGRYSNVGMAGPNYYSFVVRKAKRAPMTINTRIYSCNLIRNDLGFRWRGRYNEDTILSLDLLKAGWNTILFNAYLQKKLMTQVVPGGNTDEFYAAEGTLPKSRMLLREHPDVTRLVHRFGRAHHHVDYRPFRRPLLLRPGAGPVVEPPIEAIPRVKKPFPDASVVDVAD